ncbi:MAG: PAS domain-containing protein [Candidatus Eisenbacteria bacterium]|nr:PAS domain-containing protein [Candidatus Eisenbacteria bacterium]
MRRPRASGRRVPPHADLVRVLMADAESGVLLVDPGGRVAALNPAAAALCGVTPARARGVPAADLLRTVIAGDDPVREAFRRAATEREAVLVGRSGAEVPVLLRTFRVGDPPWVVLTLRDQTRTRRLEQELRRHERLATLGQLSAGVAHEIRNPLAGIGTSAQVLLRRFEPRDERARFVRVILDEVGRLDRIVTSLLQYARPREPRLAPTRLAPCIERVLELTRDPVAEKRLRVELDVAPRLAPVYIDADLVTQVLLNVTLNAIQASPTAGTLRYEVRTVRRPAPLRGAGRRAADPRAARAAGEARGGAARLAYQQVRVLDTGAGIPRHALPKLFDPFFSTKPSGTGLGLSISQSIMQEHGGTIAVASREGRGTTVLLNFPMEKRHGPRRHADADAGR